MATVDELRKNYESKQEKLEFLKFGTNNIIDAIINQAKIASRTRRSLEGYFSYIRDEEMYGLLLEPAALSAFDMLDPGCKGHTLNFLRIEDFGSFKDDILKNLKRVGLTAEEQCYYTNDQVNTAIMTMQNRLQKEGFNNAKICYKKIGTLQPVYGYRKATFLESIKAPINVDWYDGGSSKVNKRINMPCYGLYISISW